MANTKAKKAKSELTTDETLAELLKAVLLAESHCNNLIHDKRISEETARQLEHIAVKIAAVKDDVQQEGQHGNPYV